MTDRPEELITDVIAAHGGDLVGRVRLQKVLYLLDQLGLNSDFEYSYHHYGPYSAEIASALLDAQARNLIVDRPNVRSSDGATYSVFHTSNSLSSTSVGEMKANTAIDLLARMKSETSTVLELAATIHWLRHVEGVSKWESELERRKGSKTASGRQEKAVQLLLDLKLFN